MVGRGGVHRPMTEVLVDTFRSSGISGCWKGLPNVGQYLFLPILN